MAILNIKELVKNSPSIRQTFMKQLLEDIWYALRDSKEQIREVGSTDKYSRSIKF
jgi:hypothetical protein